jgi:flagellar basal body-associated protein FliL
MAGILEGDYGTGKQRRARVIKIIVVSVLALTVAAGTAYFFFHNYRQEQQVKQFMKLLAVRGQTYQR